MALEGHRTLLCAEVVDWLVLVACFRDIRGFARKREAVSAHAETSLPFSRSHAFLSRARGAQLPVFEITQNKEHYKERTPSTPRPQGSSASRHPLSR